MYNRTGNTLEPTHGSDTGVQIENAPQSHVEAANAAAHRRGQRAFDAYKVFLEGIHGFIGEPVSGLFVRFLPGQDLFPHDTTSVPVAFAHSRVEHPDCCSPDVRPGAVTLDIGQNRMIRNPQGSPVHGDLSALGHSRSFLHSRWVNVLQPHWAGKLSAPGLQAISQGSRPLIWCCTPCNSDPGHYPTAEKKGEKEVAGLEFSCDN